MAPKTPSFPHLDTLRQELELGVNGAASLSSIYRPRLCYPLNSMASFLLSTAQGLAHHAPHAKSASVSLGKKALKPSTKVLPNARSLAQLYRSKHQVTLPVSTSLTSARHYSGRESRRTQRQAQTQVREREQETYQNEVVPVRDRPAPQAQQPEQENTQQNNYFQGTNPNATTEELISPHVLSHLRKVYTLVGISAGAAALGGFGSVALGIGGGMAIFAGLGAIVPIMAALMMDPAKILMRQNMLLGAAALLGIGAGPLLGISSLPAILMALGGTGAIFAGFSLAALKAPSGTYLKFGGLMMGALLVLVLAGLLSWVGPMLGLPAALLAGMHSFNVYGGLLIMSLFVAYDTQSMIDRAASGETDHVSDAVNVFLDVWNIFIRLLMIFNRDD